MSGGIGTADLQRTLSGEADIRLFLLFGPEESLAEDAARKLAQLLGPDAERIDMDGGDLRSDPARLSDEAASISLFGSKRYIRLRLTPNDAVGPIENLLDAGEAGTPVIATAGNLSKANKIRKLAEGHTRAAAYGCYPLKPREAVAAIHAHAEALGVQLARPLAQAIHDATQGDPILAEQEIEKLVLYYDATPEEPKHATAEALAALGAQTAEDDISALVHAVMAGRPREMGEKLHEARYMNVNAIRIVKALERRTGQLMGLRVEVDGGRPPGQVVKASRAIFWKEQDAFAEELKYWNAPRLARANQRLIDLEGEIMSAPASMADTLLGHGLAALCRAANREARRRQ